MENRELLTYIRDTLFERIDPVGPENPFWQEFPGFMCFWRAALLRGQEGDDILVISRISDAGQIDGLSLSSRQQNTIGHTTVDEGDSWVTIQQDAGAQIEMGLWVGNERAFSLLKEFTEVVLATT